MNLTGSAFVGEERRTEERRARHYEDQYMMSIQEKNIKDLRAELRKSAVFGRMVGDRPDVAIDLRAAGKTLYEQLAKVLDERP